MPLIWLRTTVSSPWPVISSIGDWRITSAQIESICAKSLAPSGSAATSGASRKGRIGANSIRPAMIVAITCAARSRLAVTAPKATVPQIIAMVSPSSKRVRASSATTRARPRALRPLSRDSSQASAGQAVIRMIETPRSTAPGGVSALRRAATMISPSAKMPALPVPSGERFRLEERIRSGRAESPAKPSRTASSRLPAFSAAAAGKGLQTSESSAQATRPSRMRPGRLKTASRSIAVKRRGSSTSVAMISRAMPIGTSTTAARRDTRAARGRTSASVPKPMRRSSSAASVAGSSGA
ncbi:hypothetical protein BTHI11S_05379 [Bosea thiooxidans]